MQFAVSSRSHMKRLVTFLALLLVAGYCHAQIATYTGSGGLSTTIVGVANETVSALQTAGFGANTPCSSGGLSGITVNTIWSSYSTPGPRVFFKVTPNAGYMLTITGFTAGIRRSGTGPVNTRFAYSLDNGATWIDDATNHAASAGGCGSTMVSAWGVGTLPTAITSTTNGVIFALFPFAPGSSSGTYQVNTININGTVTPSCVLPTTYVVTGGGSYCAGGSGVVVGLAGSQPGVTYQLYNGAATVGSAVSGTGSAISFGTQTAAGIYTVLATGASAGCSTAMSGNATVVINPLPAAISGSLTICQGTANTLSSTSAGGTWASAPTSVATALGGAVNGIAPGTATVTYTLATGCSATAVVTVTSAPGAITGTTVVCQGLTTTLSNALTGGVWSSSSSAIATIDPATGVVTGVASGNSVISYVSSSCTPVTTVVTVNPLAAIAGAGTVCEGKTATLTNAYVGGTWVSSNTSVATVQPFSGIITGVLAGTVLISYTLPTGCQATMVVTVNAAVASITGMLVNCVGSVTMLSCATPGGSWSSVNTAVAAISLAGLAGGVSAGTSTISYTLSSGCASVATLTVHPLPAPISGSAFVCQGSTVTVSDATPGGTWSSSNSAIAAVSTTGVVSGAVIGNAYISYQLSTGCATTIAATVNPLPAAVAGAPVVCIGLSTPFSDATPGGAWSSANTAIATVNTSTGVVTGVAAGSAIISYVFGSGCYSIKTVTVNTAGTAITGPAVICAGSSILLSNTVPDGVWASGDPSIATVDTAGMLTGVAAGTTTISYTTASCNPSMLALTVNPLPLLITGIFNVCVGSATTLSNATPGGTWSITGPLATISSTGIVAGLSAGTSAHVTYTLPTGCLMTAPIVVDALPAAIAGPDSVCQGASLMLSDATPGGLWTSTDGSVASAVAVTGVVTGVHPGSVILSYTLVTGCHVEMPFRVLTPLPAAVSISITPDTAIICEGTPVTFVAHSTNGGVHPTFTWQKFTIDTLVADSFTYVPAHGDFISVKMVVDGICAAPDPATDYRYLNVYPVNVSPSVVISTGAMPHVLHYPGEVLTFYTDVTYGGTDTQYQWYINDVQVPGATNNTYSTELYRSVFVYCKVTGNPPCASSTTTGTSNSILIENATGITNEVTSSDLMLFPNPNSGVFTLGATEHVASDVTVEVTDLLGRVVYRNVVPVHNERISENIGMGDIAPGAYLLQVISGADRRRIQFVVR
jgi:uncharacterized protein YjdB